MIGVNCPSSKLDLKQQGDDKGSERIAKHTSPAFSPFFECSAVGKQMELCQVDPNSEICFQPTVLVEVVF